MRAAAVALLILLTACSRPHQQPAEGGVVVSDNMSAASVQIVQLKDGTRCAVLVGYNKGALSCDWKVQP